jgi:ribosomal-protein-alanine N-acetyltransferase
VSGSYASPELYIEGSRSGDLAAVLAIERLCFVSPWNREAFQAELGKPYAHLDVARLITGKQIGAVVGYVCFWLVADECQIVNLAVHPAYQRRGIGRLLMLHALRAGRESGSQLAVLEVRESNQAARSLYEGLGFRTVGERPGYYTESREAAVVLQLNLETGGGNIVNQ